MAPKTADDLLPILRDEQAVTDLQQYFSRSPLRYTGAYFDVLDSGGGRDDIKNVFTPADLIAVQCLSVVVPAPIMLGLLEGQLGVQIGELLSQIPADVRLGDEHAKRHVAPESYAERAWKLLRRQDDVGWVIAGKLLARKRPSLIPVWDNVVKCATGRPPNAWLWMDELLHDGRVRRELEQLHQPASLPPLVTHLRVLDVVIWMRHRQEHRSSYCPGMTSR